LKQKRLEMALTQKEAGQMLGYRKSQFISSVERGTSRPPIAVLKRMCQIYRVTEEEMRTIYMEEAVSEAKNRAEKAWVNHTVTQ
jgi:transcriptional regulator with XRE-family HTH domain